MMKLLFFYNFYTIYSFNKLNKLIVFKRKIAITFDSTFRVIFEFIVFIKFYIYKFIFFNFKLNIATPEGYAPNASFINQYKDHIRLCTNAKEACIDADLVVTDVWASMGQEQEQTDGERLRAFVRTLSPRAIIRHHVAGDIGAE